MKLFSLPLVGFFLQNLDTDLENIGLQKAMMNIVLRSKTKFIISGLDTLLKQILETKPVIVIANHPFDSEEVAIMASLPSRKDSYLIVNSHFMGVSPQLDKHLIPVYIWHHVTDGKPKKFFGRLLHKFHPTSIYPPDVEEKKNRESIRHAAKIITNGGLVIMFPGRRGKHGHWFSGIGHLIKNLGNNKHSYIVQAFVQGTSDADYLRMFPWFGRFLPTIHVTFAKPIKISDVRQADGKKIAIHLEDGYNRWIKTSFPGVIL